MIKVSFAGYNPTAKGCWIYWSMLQIQKKKRKKMLVVKLSLLDNVVCVSMLCLVSFFGFLASDNMRMAAPSTMIGLWSWLGFPFTGTVHIHIEYMYYVGRSALPGMDARSNRTYIHTYIPTEQPGSSRWRYQRSFGGPAVACCVR